MDPESFDRQVSCHGVRQFSLPQASNVILVILAVLVIVLNSLEVFSVLRNYKRLRQRIYVFVISLAVADILGGIIFLADAANRIVTGNFERPKIDDAGSVYQTLTHVGPKYVVMAENDGADFSQELLETLKAGCVVLSALNISLVTFALYKRTTSMGRHHEDFRSLDSPLGPDGRPFLPAFDTMMRVLSVGTPSIVNGLDKNMGRGNVAMQNNNRSEFDRMSSPSKMLNSSVTTDERRSGARQASIVKSSTENPRIQNASGVGRFAGTSRGFSKVFRLRRTSAAQSYVGRHSNSVMSKGVTSFSLVAIWLTFVVTCTLPLALRRIGYVDAVCSDRCETVEIAEVIPGNNEMLPSNGITAAVFGNTTFDNVDLNQVGSEGLRQNKSAGIVATSRDRKPGNAGRATAVSSDNSTFRGCVPSNYRRYTTSDASLSIAKGFGDNPCSHCSAAFYPLSKSNTIFVALVVLLTWCWLLISASRLLYLRKHSSNVFVRCSALWRFMYMTAVFSIATVAPYVAWFLVDFTTGSSADKSPIWYSAPTTAETRQTEIPQSTPQTGTLTPNSGWITVDVDNGYLLPIFGTISTCLLLVNFAVAPALYLVRLLGFRRILSAI